MSTFLYQHGADCVLYDSVHGFFVLVLGCCSPGVAWYHKEKYSDCTH